MARVILTERAKTDLKSVYEFSIKEFGIRTADKYLENIQTSLEILQEQPNLLLKKPSISKHFSLYQSGKHWLVCEKQKDFIISSQLNIAP